MEIAHQSFVDRCLGEGELVQCLALRELGDAKAITILKTALLQLISNLPDRAP